MAPSLTPSRLDSVLSLVSELRSILPEDRVATKEEELEHHAHGFGHHASNLPDAVVFPESTEEVAKILSFANEKGIPVVPFGQGSSLEGHVVPMRGGISLDTSSMGEILEVRPEDFVARVQPGVTYGKLNTHLEGHNLFFPVDPGWDASLGGMAATNASGTNAVRYGAMRDQVLGLEVVLAAGNVMRTGGLAIKSSAGYDLTGLFVGSEGTLGVFTEIILRLSSIPEHVLAARVVFPDVEKAGQAAIAMIRSGTQMGRVELVDQRTVAAVNLYKGTEYPEAPTLFLEFSGSEKSVEEDVERTRAIAEDEGCSAFDFESGEEGRERLWDARHEAGLAVRNLHAEEGSMSTDVCVPVSNLPGALKEARRVMDAHDLEGAILGHVGDGNYHAIFPVDPNDEEDLRRAEKVNAEIVDYALTRGGTCTGEHGIGVGKKEHLKKEHGDSLPFMRKIKQLADPNGIMNPDKIFPDEEREAPEEP